MAGGDHKDTRRRRRKTSEVALGHSNDDSVRSRRRHKRRDDDLPFHQLVLRVGGVLACLSIGTASIYRYAVPPVPPPLYDDDDYVGDWQQPDSVPERPVQQRGGAILDDAFLLEAEQVEPPTIPPLPVWNLTEVSESDAFAIAFRYAKDTLFWQTAAGLRAQFAESYGGENAARALLERGMTTFGTAHATACRIRRSRQQKRPFRFAFAGYSVTAGRGNYASQAYPMVLQKLLATSFSLLGIELQVRNAAIGGCPAFPYGWCLPQFLGPAPDVMSWDFSMNEAGGDPVGLEAYVRQVLRIPSRPLLIVKDTHLASARRQLLRDYVDSGLFPDPIVLHSDPAAAPFLERREEFRPVGFQEWRKFGAPPGAPGQALHHPAVKEHEMIAWMLTMHFLRALELLASADDGSRPLDCDNEQSFGLSSPLTVNTTDAPWSSLFFGQPRQEGWKMNDIVCRTTFDPILSGNLSDIVVGGSIGEDMNVMLPKSNMFYNRGWVLDLSANEKKAKHKLDRFGGLGFVDGKKAYYGLVTSGMLQFLLPYEPPQGQPTPIDGDEASKWFQSVVLCEVNEKRTERGICKLDQDVSYRLGGANVTRPTSIDAMGAQFMGQKVCVHLAVPESARLTTRGALRWNQTQSLGFVLPDDPKQQALDHQVGLALGVQVHNVHILRTTQACSISHVVWEQRSSDSL